MNILTCEKVLSLMTLYVEGNIDNEQAYEIEKHLSECSECFEKYIILKNISLKIQSAFDNVDGINIENLQKKFFNENLSAYIDNELPKNEYYAFSRYLSLDSDSKKEYDNMKYFNNKIQESLEKNSQVLNIDLAKNVVKEIKKENPAYFYEIYFKAALLIITFIILTIIAGYFSFPEHRENFALKSHLSNGFHH